MAFDENSILKLKVRDAALGKGTTHLTILDMIEKMYRNSRMLFNLLFPFKEEDMFDENGDHLVDIIEDIFNTHNRFKNFTTNERLRDFTYIRIFYCLGRITHGDYIDMINDLNDYYNNPDDGENNILAAGNYPPGLFCIRSGYLANGQIQTGTVRNLDPNSSSLNGNFYVLNIDNCHITNAFIVDAEVIDVKTRKLYKNVNIGAAEIYDYTTTARPTEPINIRGVNISLRLINTVGQPVTDVSISELFIRGNTCFDLGDISVL